ncbi:MAG: hypothetical protein HY744_19800 [Deltaproteobacteria bacterium]|nr:hypothetical protein [Deltaproteobacteria bacterium]
MRALACLLACLSLGAGARADETSDAKTKADALFKEAVAQMKARHFVEACARFQESMRLDPSSGTAFNLGRCYQQIGRTAAAFARFQDAEALARHDGRAKHEQAARRAREAIEPQLSKLVVAVPEPSRVAGLDIRLDGAQLDPVSWGVAVPVDPGSHVVQAGAPGRLGFEATVSVGAEAAVETVSIPPLQEQPVAQAPAAGPAAPAPAPPLPPPAAPPPTGAPPRAPSPAATPRPALSAPPPVAPGDTGSTQRGIAVALGVAGLAGLGVGMGFGIHAISKDGDSRDLCIPSDPNQCTAEGKVVRDEALAAATVSTAAIIGGAVVLAGGVTLYLTAPSASEPAAGPARRGPAGAARARIQARASFSGLSLRAGW